MNSARPQDTLGSSSPRSMRVAPVSIEVTRSRRPSTWARSSPSGDSRGSKAGESVATVDTTPESMWQTYGTPSRAKVTIRPVRSVANEVIPPACSRRRSRIARSAADSAPAVPRVRGSTTSRSPPPSRSATHRALTGSSPAEERRNTTARPSAVIRRSRGVPRVRRRVRAYCLGKLSALEPVLARSSSVTVSVRGWSRPRWRR